MTQLGDLSAAYESSKKGSMAIGWDRGGHLSLGKYQIAHATGTLRRYLDFCREHYPMIYNRLWPLFGSIPSGSESKTCPFAEEWVRLAKQGALEDSEHRFIKHTHFDPAFRRLPSNIKSRVAASMALQQVLWSMSVQHRGSTVQKLFARAYKDTTINNREFIIKLYAARTAYVRQITKLSTRTRAAVIQRYESECDRALAMLEAERAK